MPRGVYSRKPRESQPASSPVAVAEPEAPVAPAVEPKAESRTFFVTLAKHKGQWKRSHITTDKPLGYGRTSYAGEMCLAITIKVEAACEDDAFGRAMESATRITL